MKVEIWNEVQKKAKQPLRLRLVSLGGGIELQVVDKKGNCIDAGHLLSINSLGGLHLASDISKKIGLKLDRRGCLKVTK
jgi:hypothetical protein